MPRQGQGKKPKPPPTPLPVEPNLQQCTTCQKWEALNEVMRNHWSKTQKELDDLTEKYQDLLNEKFKLIDDYKPEELQKDEKDEEDDRVTFLKEIEEQEKPKKKDLPLPSLNCAPVHVHATVKTQTSQSSKPRFTNKTMKKSSSRWK